MSQKLTKKDYEDLHNTILLYAVQGPQNWQSLSYNTYKDLYQLKFDIFGNIKKITEYQQINDYTIDKELEKRCAQRRRNALNEYFDELEELHSLQYRASYGDKSAASMLRYSGRRY